MTLTLNINLPEGVDETLRQHLDHAAREAIAVELYKQGKLSHGSFATFLGIGRGEVDTILGAHGVMDEFTAEEIMAQAKAVLDAMK